MVRAMTCTVRFIANSDDFLLDERQPNLVYSEQGTCLAEKYASPTHAGFGAQLYIDPFGLFLSGRAQPPLYKGMCFSRKDREETLNR